MRRTGLLTALLLTAALLCAMPGLVRSFGAMDDTRMDPRLRPAQSRTLALWVLGGGLEDSRLLRSLLADFEKEHRGLRVFLRNADPEELADPRTVPPHGVFYATGDVLNPESVFLPLDGLEGPAPGALSSAQSSGEVYAAPLWFSVNVLSLPSGWLETEGQSPGALPLPARPVETPAPSAPAELPWRKLLAEGGLWIQDGVAHSQMLSLCPASLRSDLAAAAQAGLRPKAGMARAWTLNKHLAAVKAGEGLTALPLPPPVGNEARYFSLTKDDEDSRALLRFLLSPSAGQTALDAAFLPGVPGPEAAHPVTAAVQALFQDGFLLPNAFAHAKGEVAALCRDGLLRGTDPVETLLRLR